MGVRLGVLGRSDDEIAAYQGVIARYGEDPAAALREQTANAQIGRASCRERV